MRPSSTADEDPLEPDFAEFGGEGASDEDAEADREEAAVPDDEDGAEERGS